jgi:phenylalanyl-tRNA synthetase beta chain
MHISLHWLNHYLEPGDVSAEEAEKVLTYAGFPIESATKLPSGDTMLDVEVTSNRGDVLSHIGVAREIAAAAGASKVRRLKTPAADSVFGETPAAKGNPPTLSGPDASAVLSLENRVIEACPLFTARIITGVKVGPSPKWLVDALESVGQRSINNVVDITNFVSFEYGQPSHVFDLAKIAKSEGGKAKIIVRAAAKGEKLALLDGNTIELRPGEIVVADESSGGRVLSLAGVMGGSESGVTEKTTDVVLEAATWDPVAIRRAARRLALRTDASYRFERIVDPRTIEAAAKRLAALIVKLAGGTLLPGVLAAGAPPKERTIVNLRPERVAAMLGEHVPMHEVQRILSAHEIDAKLEKGVLHGGSKEMGTPVLMCTIPPHRPDLEREIDLIEEVARTWGLDKLPVHERVGVRVGAPQAAERAVEELGRVLTGLGFYETVTFTFISPKAAKPFVPAGMQTMTVCDERRKADPVLRPSAIPSLMACRRANQDRGAAADGAVGGVSAGGGVRLFEISSSFAQTLAEKGARGVEKETVNVALLVDCCFPAGAKSLDQKQAAVRMVRGAIESGARALGGEAVRVEVLPSATPPSSAWDATAFAEVKVNGERVGCMGLISSSVQAEHGLESPIVAAELNLASLIALWPPKSAVRALPAFPSIERDLSLIVREETAWAKVDSLIGSLGVERLESWAFVGAYRGQQAGPGKKSVTLRMRFRDAARTLTHDEVSPQVESIIAAAKKELGAEVRTT